jgi:hypothetical protein
LHPPPALIAVPGTIPFDFPVVRKSYPKMARTAVAQWHWRANLRRDRQDRRGHVKISPEAFSDPPITSQRIYILFTESFSRGQKKTEKKVGFCRSGAARQKRKRGKRKFAPRENFAHSKDLASRTRVLGGNQ